MSALIERSVDPTVSPIGDVKLSELSADRVAEWSRAIQRVRAVNTARHVLGHLRQICQYGRAGSPRTRSAVSNGTKNRTGKRSGPPSCPDGS